MITRHDLHFEAEDVRIAESLGRRSPRKEAIQEGGGGERDRLVCACVP
jgi:hypothetical protein